MKHRLVTTSKAHSFPSYFEHLEPRCLLSASVNEPIPEIPSSGWFQGPATSEFTIPPTVSDPVTTPTPTNGLQIGPIDQTNFQNISTQFRAIFSDTGVNLPASDYTATFSWGDDTTSTAATIQKDYCLNLNCYHTYATSGQFDVTLTITTADGRSAVANGLATIMPDPGQTLPQPIPDPAPVQGPPAPVQVSNPTQVSLTPITDLLPIQIVVSYPTPINPPQSSSNGVTFTPVPTNNLQLQPINTTGLQNLATTFSAIFTDSAVNLSAGAYTATIAWGDGTTSTGTITPANDFAVTSDHTYTSTGQFDVILTITTADGRSAVAKGVATIMSDPVVPSLNAQTTLQSDALWTDSLALL